MSTHTYLQIIRIFLIVMPLELLLVGTFASSCVKAKQTNQPTFWYALLCVGILIPEIIRGWYILLGEIPPHPKHIQLWIVELLPFGGFTYEVCKKYVYKMLQEMWNDAPSND